MNWNRLNHPMLRDEADGSGDGSGGQGSAHEQSVNVFGGQPSGDGQQDSAAEGQGQQQAQTGEEGGQQGTPPPIQLSQEMLSQIIRESTQVAAQAGGPQTRQAPAPVNEDELFKAFKAPAIDEAMYVQMFGLKPENPQQLAAVNNVFRQFALVAARMAAAHGQQTINGIKQEYAPLRQTILTQQAEREESQFYGEFKHLEPHKDTVKMVKAQMLVDGVKFPSLAAAKKGLAVATENYLKKIGVAVGANGGQGQGARPNGGGMPRTNVGGQSSHGRGGPQGAKTPLQESVAIFGKGTR